MYPNLDAEMARYGIRRKDIADKIFNGRTATASDKLNGKYPLLLNEAVKIKEAFFPDLPLDYLFERKDDQTA